MTTEVMTRLVEPRRYGTHVPILILSITLDPEYHAVETLLPEIGATRLPQTDADKILEIERWNITRDDRQTMELATGYIDGMGNVRTALETLMYVQRISPRYVFLCGIAGSLEPRQIDLGDVVLGKTVTWWNLNKVQPDRNDDYFQIGDSYFRKEITNVGKHTRHWNMRLSKFQFSNKNLLRSNTDGTLLALKSRISGSASPRINLMHYGKIISWEYVLSHEHLRNELRRLTIDGLAIEMEGAGFYSSIERRNEELDLQQKQTNRSMETEVQGFIFRGISDLSFNKGTEDSAWRQIAMFNAAASLLKFVRTFTDIDFKN
jgi:nucleoside phosphorylase